MANRNNRASGEGLRGILRTALIFLVVFVLMDVFKGELSPAGAVSVPGLAVMALGVIAVLCAGLIAGRLPEDRQDRAAAFIKLAGVLVCGVGAIIVFMG